MPGSVGHSGVVVGVDGSAGSHTAVRRAAREAAMRNVPLTLIHAVKLKAASATDLTSAVTSVFLDPRKVMADAIAVARHSVAGGGLDCDGEVIHGHPVSTLVDASKEAQLVVVGTYGQGAFGRTLLGSVSTGRVHHAHCPVAVIRDYPASATSPNKLPVVVGIDGSPASELAAAIAFDEASWRGVDLIAVNVFSDADLSPLPDLQWPTCEPTPR